MKRRPVRLALALLIPVLSAAGCGAGANTDGPLYSQVRPREQGDEHSHQLGAHGGDIVAIGSNHYHAEVVFTEGAGVKFFLLGKDESSALDVDEQTLTAYVKVRGQTQALSMALKPERLPGDPPGRTSAFAGRLPDGCGDRDFVVSVPRINIGGERLRFAFERQAPPAMPEKLVDQEERQLYLTPGGIYTRADIEANGGQTASQRFKSFKAGHDHQPHPGDRLCPVTLTKANPDCTWVVGGRKYEFCCPPCVDEFVRLAKENPGAIKPPNKYVKE